MKKVIFIPWTTDKEEYYSLDYPTASYSHFFPWISKQLIVNDIMSYVIENPFSYMPDYELWKKELERYEIDKETVLVWHSCGWWFLLRYLSENPQVRAKKIILLAPWIDPFNEKKNDFFIFRWDDNLFENNDIEVIYSLDDFEAIIVTVKEIKKRYRVNNIREFTDKWHFCYNEIWETFPELRDKLLDIFK